MVCDGPGPLGQADIALSKDTMNPAQLTEADHDPAFVLQTERLILRRFRLSDAEFIVGLLNEPSFLRYIGDKGVRTIEEAHAYLQGGPIDSYNRLGFGLYLTIRKADGVPIGMCGLLKRDSLPDVDIGFAFLPSCWGQGFAFESASAVIEHGRSDFGLARIVAVTNIENHDSIRLLERLGFVPEGLVRLSEPGEELRLMARAL